MTPTTRTASVARRAVLVAAIALVLTPAPVRAGLFFEQLNSRVTYFEKLRDERIVNENLHHQTVMKEIGYERKMADEAMEAGLKTCTTAQCKATFRKDNAQTQSALDAKEEDENTRHAAKLKQIKTELGAEIKKLQALEKSSASPAPF